MGSRNWTTILNRELSNLDKDLKTRKSAMKALKSYVESKDSSSIPLFLSRVSETKETGLLSGEYTVSLFEVLARVHGVKTVPHIDTIMKFVIKTLSASAGSSSLQQACSKVATAFVRYGIEPGTREEEKRKIIDSICNPLAEALISNQECLSSGAALCLKALVESDNWRFASHLMVNKACQNVAVALEEPEKAMKSNSHMSLVMSLSKRAPSFVEAYARLFLKAGVTILNAGRVHHHNSQKRLLAIQMVDFMMKCLDRESISPSMLDSIVEEMESCLSDEKVYVTEAALQALQTAKRISEEGSKFDKGSGSARGRSRSRRMNFSSPESREFDSCVEYDSMVESSPRSRTPFDHKQRSRENGGVDVSLRDGLFSELAHDHGCRIDNSSHLTSIENDAAEEFSGFPPRSPRNGRMPRVSTPSPQVCSFSLSNRFITSSIMNNEINV
ncbi:Protein SINE1 [Linum perenne]